MFPCIESTIDVTFGHRTVRLWLARQDVPILPDELGTLVSHIRYQLNTGTAHNELLTWLATLPNINAVQVIELHPYVPEARIGTMIYTVEF